jgi:hypothetical protein
MVQGILRDCRSSHFGSTRLRDVVVFAQAQNSSGITIGTDYSELVITWEARSPTVQTMIVIVQLFL